MSTAFVFDLDDTLVLEEDYFRQGLHGCAQILLDFALPGQFEAEAIRQIRDHGPMGVFDRTLRVLEVSPADALLVMPELIKAYRLQRSSLAPFDDVFPVLSALREAGYLIGLITDGRPESQNEKIALSGVAGLIDTIIVTSELSPPNPKPAPAAFLAIEAKLKADDYFYVGDNPAKDFLTPLGLGWQVRRIRRAFGFHRNIPNPDGADIVEIKSLYDLLPAA
jgi:putative hydrolase of the HAD superfamily